MLRSKVLHDRGWNKLWKGRKPVICGKTKGFLRRTSHFTPNPCDGSLLWWIRKGKGWEVRGNIQAGPAHHHVLEELQLRRDSTWHPIILISCIRTSFYFVINVSPWKHDVMQVETVHLSPAVPWSTLSREQFSWIIFTQINRGSLKNLKCPSPPCGGDSSGRAACLSGHTQFHYVHTWGLCEWTQQISCEGVKDLWVKDADKWRWLHLALSEREGLVSGQENRNKGSWSRFQIASPVIQPVFYAKISQMVLSLELFFF